MSFSQCIVKSPVLYEATLSKEGLYIDNLDKYEWSAFQNYGIRCNCSKTIHRNKNSFKFSHCNTKKHQLYIKSLNENKVNLSKEDKKEIKEFKIIAGREHQNYLREKERTKVLEQQVKDLLIEKSEAQIEINQGNEYILQLNKSINTLKQNNGKLLLKLKQFDDISKQLILLGGYEIED